MRAKRTTAVLVFAAAFAAAPLYGQQKASKGPAASYPDKPVRLIVPVAAGGGTDIIARLIGQGLSDRWGQPVVVDNRPGAGGRIGSQIVVKSAPDGYTMLLGSIGHITFAPALFRDLPYRPQTDLAPISLVANQPFGKFSEP